MVVQHNMQAMNANRMLNVTTGAQSKSTEKLSSGYKINRAADDAAGLSISEKMRKQIRGLDQASSNAQDGVSAVQTAEGALTEVHSMLQRMNELAVQAANGTNSETDRQSIQDEIDQLTTEIDRVAETTKFNETYLLKGDADGGKKTQYLNAHDAGLKGTLQDVQNSESKATFKADALEVGSKVSIGGKEYEIVASADASAYQSIKGASFKAGDKITAADGTNYTYYAAANNSPLANNQNIGAGFYSDAEVAAFATASSAVSASYTPTAGDAYVATGTTEPKTLIGADTTAMAAETKVDDAALKTALQALSKGDKVSVGSSLTNKTDYTIGTYDDAANSTYTVETLLTKIKGGDMVYTAAAAKTIGDNSDTTAYFKLPNASTDPSKITLHEAYDKMAEELKKASDIGADKDTLSTVENNYDGTFTITKGKVEVAKQLSFNLHVGADADMTNKIGVDIETMNSAYLGVKGLNVTDASGTAATYAIDAIADAVAKVSSQRSALGAVQNRLEHTIANVDNVVENSTSAESRIRDTDMAEEMVNYSKNNILAQAGQSMLAQANQSNQGVLSLLG